jgi:hypothetical protein
VADADDVTILDKAGRKAARQPDTASSTTKPADTTTEE